MASRAMKIDPKKAGSSEPQTATPTRQQTPPESRTTPDNTAIEVRAYELWCARGCPDGSPELDWYQAEEELRGNGA